MGDARRRRLDREAGRPWREDLPAGTSEPVQAPVLPVPPDELSSEGFPITLCDTSHDRLLELARQLASSEGRTSRILVVGRPVSPVQELLMSIPEVLFADPMVAATPMAARSSRGKRRRRRA